MLSHFQLSVKQVIPDLDNLRLLASKKGTDGWVIAEDYFITTRDGFPWKSIPKLVIGRIGYDNWMVSQACDKGIAYFSLLAFHTFSSLGKTMINA